MGKTPFRIPIALSVSLMLAIPWAIASAAGPQPNQLGTRFVPDLPTSKSGTLAPGYSVAETFSGSCAGGSLMTLGLSCLPRNGSAGYELC